MYSIIISLIVYFVSSYYLSKFLDNYLMGTPKRMVVFIIASAISWLVSTGIDWAFPAQAISFFQ